MSGPTLLQIAVLLLVLGSGVGIGLYLGTNSSAAGSAAKSHVSTWVGSASDADAPGDLKSNTLLSSRIRELEKNLADLKAQNAATALDRIAFFKTFGKAINITPFDESLHVTPEMAALLGLSGRERQSIEQQLSASRAELGKLSDADTKVLNQTDTSVTYEISPDKQGDQIKQQLHDALNQEIGEDRAGIFMCNDGQNWAFNSQFSGFMEARQGIEISWKEENNAPMYMVKVTSGTGIYTNSGTRVDPQYQKYLPSDLKP